MCTSYANILVIAGNTYESSILGRAHVTLYTRTTYFSPLETTQRTIYMDNDEVIWTIRVCLQHVNMKAKP